jgi:threonine/homoserine/homoserine lactone efflux protein
MFDYPLAHWATFFTAAILLNLSPGPDMAFILAQTAKGGVRSGFSAMFGIWTGAFMHVLFAAWADYFFFWASSWRQVTKAQVS